METIPNQLQRLWFPPLEQQTKPNLTTEEAAYYLNRRPQTLRIWACKETGPLRPNRTFGRLDWPTHKVRALSQGETQ